MAKSKKGVAPPKSASGAPKKAPGSRSAKAGLTFPVSRVNRHLRDSGAMKRVGAGAPVYLAAILEYITAEVLELSGNTTVSNKRKRITPQDVMRSIRADPELHRVLGGAVVFTGDRVKDVTAAVTVPKEKPAPVEAGGD